MKRFVGYALVIILTSAISVGLTFFVMKDRMDREKALVLRKQSQAFFRIGQTLSENEKKWEYAEKSLATFQQDLERFWNLNEKILYIRTDVNEEVLCHFAETLFSAEEIAPFPSAPDIRERMIVSYEQFAGSAVETRKCHADFVDSVKHLLSETKGWVSSMKKNTRFHLNRYKKMMSDVRQFVSLPVKLDFNPKEDIAYIERRIGENRDRLVRLKQFGEKLKDCKKWVPGPAF